MELGRKKLKNETTITKHNLANFITKIRSITKLQVCRNIYS